jgi:hypothetical protein
MTTPTDRWENLYLAAGSPAKVFLVGFRNDSLKPLTGKSLADIAALRGTSPEETMMDLVIQDGSRVSTVYFLMSEENVKKQIRIPWVSFGSDAESISPDGIFLKWNPHPRAYGNFSRLLGTYVRDLRVIPLEEAVRRLTSLPASNLKIRKRGILRPGYFADIVVFNPDSVRDNATYDKPHRYSSGVEQVFVNGVQVLHDGEHTGAFPGRIVRGPGWKRAAGGAQNSLRFAVIGDYGHAGDAEKNVADMIRSWDPSLIITTGDNNYDSGEAKTIDANIGQYYHSYIYPYTGVYGKGDTVNDFFPTIGNHDWVTAGAAPYLSYFTLPGNERYYDFVRGPVHFFALDSDTREPDGTTSSSRQATWLRGKLAASTSAWNIVYFHHPPYSSGSQHGPTPAMQWPFRAWGASAVISGHDHDYERLTVDSLTYLINGLGGRSLYRIGQPVAGSQVRYDQDYGAMKVDADDAHLTFRFVTRKGELIDTYTLENPRTTGPHGK